MTDEARIQRLTELADRRWPGQGCRIVQNRYDDCVEVVNDRDVVKVHIQDIRALDALEAALQVLADVPLDWVERLCWSWEYQSKLAIDPRAARAIRQCATELRKRASKP
jgi:hypothetical protein